MLDVSQSAQCLGLVLTTQISPPNSRILHLRLGSHKERLGRAQEAVKRLWKWSGSSNPREWGWSAFYRESKKLAVGAVRLDQSDRSTIPASMVTPTGLKALSDGNSLNWQIWVRTRTCPVMARLVRWRSNSNCHIVYRISLVQYQTSPVNYSRSR
jgi:hypothetical protein